MCIKNSNLKRFHDYIFIDSKNCLSKDSHCENGANLNLVEFGNRNSKWGHVYIYVQSIHIRTDI